MLNSLKNVQDKPFNSNKVALCAELLFVMKKKTFTFSLCIMLKCLRYIKPANKIVQSRTGVASESMVRVPKVAR